MLRRHYASITYRFFEEFERRLKLLIFRAQSFFQDVIIRVAPLRNEFTQKAIDAERFQTSINAANTCLPLRLGRFMSTMEFDKTSYNAMLLGNGQHSISDGANLRIRSKSGNSGGNCRITRTKPELLELQINQHGTHLTTAINKLRLARKCSSRRRKLQVVDRTQSRVSVCPICSKQGGPRKAQDKLIEFKTNYKYAIATYIKAIVTINREK